MVNRRWVKVVILLGVLVCLPLLCLSLPLVTCPRIVPGDEGLPCDETIENPHIYETIILSNPVVEQLNRELRFTQFSMARCFTQGKAQVSLKYELPQRYSQYGIVYADTLILVYSKDGTIEVSNISIKKPVAFACEPILTHFKDEIQQVESDPRVREFITKTEPGPRNPIVSFYESHARISRQIPGHGDYWIEYNLWYGMVRGYLLPSAIRWQEFPEIEQSHRIIKENLLVGNLAKCSIGYSGEHSCTGTNFHDFEKGPWYLTVALICEDGRKDAFLQLNYDGTYERLSIAREY